MPPAELAGAQGAAGEAKTSGEVARVLADALSGGGTGDALHALLDALPGNGGGPVEAFAIAAHAAGSVAAADGWLASVNVALSAESVVVHPDATPLV